jgi:hypothetical protein
MVGFGVSPISTGNPSVLSERNHGVCYVSFETSLTFLGCAQKISLKLFMAMSRSKAMRGRNGVWKGSGKQ